MEVDYSKHTDFRWKIKWRLEHLGVLGVMGETDPLRNGPLFNPFIAMFLCPNYP